MWDPAARLFAGMPFVAAEQSQDAAPNPSVSQDDFLDFEGDNGPPPCAYCGNASLAAMPDNGRTQRAKCTQCGGVMTSSGGAWSPELIGDPSNHPSSAADPASGGVGGAANADVMQNVQVRTHDDAEHTAAFSVWHEAARDESPPKPEWLHGMDVPGGPYYHGTRADVQEGDLLHPGYRMPNFSGFGRKPLSNIYFSTDHGEAAGYGKDSRADGEVKVYQVEPTGPIEHDPMQGEWRGGRDLRSEHPLRVVRRMDAEHTAAFDSTFSTWHLAGYDMYGEWDGQDDDEEATKSVDWDERHPHIHEMHRGIGVMLPDELHHFVHDRSKPLADRAHALLNHVSNGSHVAQGLGVHWTDHENTAHSFAQDEAKRLSHQDKKQRRDNNDFSWGHEADDPEIPHGKPATQVVFHSAQPPRESINHNFDPNGYGSGAIYEHDEHGESEIPITPGGSVPIKGITFKQHKHDFDETPEDWNDEGEHHEFAEHQWHEAALHILDERTASFDAWMRHEAMPGKHPAPEGLTVDRYDPPPTDPYHHGELEKLKPGWSHHLMRSWMPSSPTDWANKRMVGSIMYSKSPEGHQPPTVAVHRMYVGEDERHQGVASAMQDELHAQHPDHLIDHGDRSDAGMAWWKQYQTPDEHPNAQLQEGDALLGRTSTLHTAISWDEVGERHPEDYGDEEVHGEAASGADGERIGWAANQLAHDRPDDPDAENSGSWDLDFHEEHVDPKHIDYKRHGGLNDGRVRSAHEGYKSGANVPPVVLVHRHGVYQVADGHHRAEAAHLAGVKVPAYVHYSDYEHEPFSNGDVAPFHGAEPHEPAGHTAALNDDVPWCAHLYHSQCTKPMTMTGLDIPQSRGACPWKLSASQQMACPISDPGPQAAMMTVAGQNGYSHDHATSERGGYRGGPGQVGGPGTHGGSAGRHREGAMGAGEVPPARSLTVQAAIDPTADTVEHHGFESLDPSDDAPTLHEKLRGHFEFLKCAGDDYSRMKPEDAVAAQALREHHQANGVPLVMDHEGTFADSHAQIAAQVALNHRDVRPDKPMPTVGIEHFPGSRRGGLFSTEKPDQAEYDPEWGHIRVAPGTTRDTRPGQYRDRGFHSASGGTNGLRRAVTHEQGHHLDFQLSPPERGRMFQDLAGNLPGATPFPHDEATQENTEAWHRQNIQHIANHVGIYAASSPHETIGELYTEHRHADHPSAAATTVGRHLEGHAQPDVRWPGVDADAAHVGGLTVLADGDYRMQDPGPMAVMQVSGGKNGELPDGLTFDYKDRGDSHKVMAIHPQHGQIGQLTWYKSAHPGHHKAGEVDGIEVDPGYQRRGIASAMWDHARSLNVRPQPQHSDEQTGDGTAWTQHVGVLWLRSHIAEGDYRMQHQAPDADYGAPLHNVESMMPDFYTHPHYYNFGQEDFHNSASKIQGARDQPEKLIRVYRALPAEHAHEGFHTGDWVSTSRDYARGEGRVDSDTKNDMPVITTRVPAKHLHTEGDVHEWGYSGPEKNYGHMVSFKGGANQEVRQHADGVIRPVRRRANPLKGYSFTHTVTDQNTDNPIHTVEAYDPEENYVGHHRADAQGHSELHVELVRGRPLIEQKLRTELNKHLGRKQSALDNDFFWHFTATWSDVRAKAKRLRAEGAVRIAAVTVDGVQGEVKGDYHIYETGLNFVPGSHKVGSWECGCKWSAYAWGRSPAYKRFEGRMCFTPGMQVSMADGTHKLIEQISPGDRVLTHNGVGTVHDLWENHYNGEIVGITRAGSSRQVWATSDHGMLANTSMRGNIGSPSTKAYRDRKAVQNKQAWERTEAGQLQVGDWLMGTYSDVVQKAPNFSLSELHEHVVVREGRGRLETPTERSARIYVGASLPEFSYTDPFAVLLGYYLAEGNVEHRNVYGVPRIVQWTLGAQEQECVDEIVGALDDLGAGVPRLHRSHNRIVVKVSNATLALLLAQLTGTHAATKTFHPDLMQAPLDFQETLLRTYLNGDGCESKASTASIELARQLVTIGCRIGSYIPREHTSTNNQGPNNREPGNPIYYVETSGRFMQGRERLWENFYGSRITAVERKRYHGTVYNLNVDDQHTYAVEDTVVFNCSHALAMQFEAQARGMFGKDIREDQKRPEWLKAHSPVVIQYERPTDKHPSGIDLTRRAVPPGNMRRTWGSYRYQQTVQGPNGYSDEEREIEGPLYHGGRGNLGPGDHIVPGRKTNSWGDEGVKSTHVYFTSDPDTALSYTQQIGPKGKLYEVEPTGDFKKDYGPQDYKTPHPLRVVRQVPQGEWPTWARHTSQREAALDDVQQRALARLAPMPEKIEGKQLHDLYTEHGITLHANSPQVDMEDNFPPDRDMRHVAADEPLHTSQNFLIKSTLAKHIQHPYEYSPSDYDPMSHDNRVWTLQHRGVTWIGEGHHRIMADRMTHRRGTTTGHRDLDEEYGPDFNSETPHYGQEFSSGMEAALGAKKETCATCGGSGKLTTEEPLYDDDANELGYDTQTVPCEDCEGRGWNSPMTRQDTLRQNIENGHNFLDRYAEHDRQRAESGQGHDRTCTPYNCTHRFPRTQERQDYYQRNIPAWEGEVHKQGAADPDAVYPTDHELDLEHSPAAVVAEAVLTATGDPAEVIVSLRSFGMAHEAAKQVLRDVMGLPTTRGDGMISTTASDRCPDCLGPVLASQRQCGECGGSLSVIASWEDDEQRCPHCGGYLGPSAFKAGRCPHCGHALSHREGARGRTFPHLTFWHGTPSGDLRGGPNGLHVGTQEAARQALHARIGRPAEGEWDGTREYGKTPLQSYHAGHSSGIDAPHYPTGKATYGDGTPIPLDSKPDLFPVRITGEMSNSPDNPHEDFKANGYMRGQISRGNAKRGYFYTNVAEDDGSISAVVPNEGHLERLPRPHEAVAKTPPAVSAEFPEGRVQTQDARAHATDFGEDVPEWHAGGLDWCDQCGGIGCGHCGGTGQVIRNDQGQTMNPVPDQNHDAGTVMRETGLSSQGAKEPEFYHGTRYKLQRGQELTGGHMPSNQGYGTPGDHVYYTGRHDIASVFAEAANGPEDDYDARPRVYRVQPMEGHEADPDEAPEVQSYRAKRVRVLGPVAYNADAVRRHWQGAKKSTGPSVAGVALKADDTGRVLMLQRGMEDKKDPARGTWEFPGGHIEPGDKSSVHGAIREWEEEVGQPFPEGAVLHHSWTSPNGIYQGHVMSIPEERSVVMHDGRVVPNPDDPKGDMAEQAAWWQVDHAKKNPALRPELKANTPWAKMKSAGADLQKSAGAEALPVEPGLYYRTHHKNAPFGPSHATTQNLNVPDGAHLDKFRAPQEGYSAFWHPHHLHQYLNEHGWTSQGQDIHDRNVIAFRGTPVGEGGDGEPRVMPHRDTPEHTMSWQEFQHNLDRTPEPGTRWSDHTWGDGPNGQQVDDGYRTVGDFAKEADYAANDPFAGLEEHTPTDPPLHSNSTNPASTGYATAYDSEGWQGQTPFGGRDDAPMASYEADLHTVMERPERVVPTTVGTVLGEWGQGSMAVVFDRSSTLHEQPEPALPATDGDREWSHGQYGDPNHPYTGDDEDMQSGDLQSIEDETSPNSVTAAREDEYDPEVATIVARFQATAAANGLMSSGGGRGVGPSGGDIAGAAQAFLQKTALKDFNFAEQQELINEHQGGVHARNTDSLQIQGTHYELLDQARGMDSLASDDLFV